MFEAKAKGVPVQGQWCLRPRLWCFEDQAEVFQAKARGVRGRDQGQGCSRPRLRVFENKAKAMGV